LVKQGTRTGDSRVEVTVEVGSFRGSGKVWLGRGDYDRFLESFSALVRTRNGEATLRAMSPDAFELVFRPTDGLGHVKMTGVLRENRHGRYSALSEGISFEVELDGEFLEEYARSFGRLRSAG
jgi:hypothetical protein